METFSALPTLPEGNPPIAGGFPSQKASNAGFGVINLSLNKQLNK